MRIVLDSSRCSSLGMCEAVAPELFQVGDNGGLTLLEPNPGQDQQARAQEAVAGCPTAALHLEP